MFVCTGVCLRGCSTAKQFTHTIHGPSDRSGLATHHGEQGKWSRGDRSRLDVGKSIGQLFARDCCADEFRSGWAFWVSCGSLLILEIVLHLNFLIRLVGNFTADAEYQARSCWVFLVVSGKKWKNFSLSCMQGNARRFHFYAKKERE